MLILRKGSLFFHQNVLTCYGYKGCFLILLICMLLQLKKAEAKGYYCRPAIYTWSSLVYGGAGCARDTRVAVMVDVCRGRWTSKLVRQTCEISALNFSIHIFSFKEGTFVSILISYSLIHKFSYYNKCNCLYFETLCLKLITYKYRTRN